MMKKIISSVLVLVVILAALSVAAFATTYERDFYDDLTIGYNTFLPTLSERVLRVVYAPMAEGSSTTYAETQLDMPNECPNATGRVSTQINGIYGDIQVGSSTSRVNNSITYRATCQDDSPYAVKVNHYANRRLDFNASVDMWNYWFYNGG